jgi:hypothetical protein
VIWTAECGILSPGGRFCFPCRAKAIAGRLRPAQAAMECLGAIPDHGVACARPYMWVDGTTRKRAGAGHGGNVGQDR